MNCSNCGNVINLSNYSIVDKLYFCSDACNVKYHNWDKIPDSKALSIDGK